MWMPACMWHGSAAGALCGVPIHRRNPCCGPPEEGAAGIRHVDAGLHAARVCDGGTLQSVWWRLSGGRVAKARGGVSEAEAVRVVAVRALGPDDAQLGHVHNMNKQSDDGVPEPAGFPILLLYLLAEMGHHRLVGKSPPPSPLTAAPPLRPS